MKVFKALNKFECVKAIIACCIGIPAAAGMMYIINLSFTDPEASETIQTVLGAVRFVFTAVLILVMVLLAFVMAQNIFKLYAISSSGEQYHIDGLRRFETAKQIVSAAVAVLCWGMFAAFGLLAVFPDMIPGNVTNTEDELASVRVIGIVFVLIALGAVAFSIVKMVKNIRKAREYYDYENYKARMRRQDEQEEELQETIQTIKENITGNAQAPAPLEGIEGGEDTDNPFI